MPHIIIVGGGVDGWFTAAYLASRFNCSGSSRTMITVVEKNELQLSGLGEGTTPSIRSSLAEMGLDEFEFMSATNATFKHGTSFENWTKDGEGKRGHAYFHPFERPLRAGNDALVEYWLRGGDPFKREFSSAVGVQTAIAMAGHTPKCYDDDVYCGSMPYAYHIDAALLATLLKNVALRRSVNHRTDELLKVESTHENEIDSLVMGSGVSLSGDFYIDCSGKDALLMGKHSKSQFTDLGDILFCDRTISCQFPFAIGEQINPYSTSTAMSSGWLEDMGLTSGRCLSYIYSSRYISDEMAELELREHLGLMGESVTTQKTVFNVGYRQQPWLKNCVAVGSSAGCIDPIGSTRFQLIEHAVWALVSMLPRYFQGLRPQAQFNELMSQHYKIAIDFTKYHFISSKREDSAFWIDNRSPETLTTWLKDKSETWGRGYPEIYDMDVVHSIFDHSSYQYVYFGMKGNPKISFMTGGKDTLASSIFKSTNIAAAKALENLPKHNVLLNKINNFKSGHIALRDRSHFSIVNNSVVNIPNNYTL